jgi:hypothetical protein
MTRLLTVHRSLFTLFLVACDPTLPPLRGQLEVGRDPYAVFVGGDGPNSDLYAVRPDGGPPVRITFTNVAELAPALSPDGGGLAFLRGASLGDSTPGSIWVMNLLSGSERELVLPKGSGRPIGVGWEPGGKALIAFIDSTRLRPTLTRVRCCRRSGQVPNPAWRSCWVIRCSPARYRVKTRLIFA